MNRSNAAMKLASPPGVSGDDDNARDYLDPEEEREMLLRVMAHDLRGPLSTISIGIELVRRDVRSKARILAVMESTVQRMDRLIGELVHFARKGELR
jgi:signal transduction histidine kinase